MSQFVWVAPEVVLAVHDAQLAEHGGLSGVRDENLFRSTLMRPQNQLAYGTPDLADLAAAYGYGLARNHPFNDGNKRTALAITEIFLALNKIELLADDAQCVLAMVAVADAAMSEVEFAAWLRTNMQAKA